MKEWTLGPDLFTRIATTISYLSDPQEALELSRLAAAKLGFDATQLWIEAQRLAPSRRAGGADSL